MRARRGQVIRTQTIPAPLGGLNARDNIAEMAATDAVAMDNYVPGLSNVMLRPGYRKWATGLPTLPVESLLPYRAGATLKMFAACGTGLYDVTTKSAVGAPVVTGLANARFQWVNFGTPGGQFLLAVNGTDPMQVFNGTAWGAEGLGVGAPISSITYVGTTATLTTATPHGLGNGNTVTVAGAAPTNYNVTAAAITVLSATSFQYTMASAPASNATTVGTYSYQLAVTGVDTRNCFSINAFGQRIWLLEKNTFHVWYLPIQSIAGTATLLDLSSLFRMGGALAGMITWTVAGTTATEQFAVFVSTEGEVIIYQGYDPANAATWSLTGQARIGRPVGSRFWTRVGTDIVLIGSDGFVPLSQVLQLDRKYNSNAVSNKIVNAANQAYQFYGQNFGWQVILYPSGNRLIVNVPQIEGNLSFQFVMNTVTGAWCRYTNLNAFCWEVTQDTIFFGGLGFVYQAEYGSDDDGMSIQGMLQPAFSYFGNNTANKRFTQVRPVLESNGRVAGSVRLVTNFDRFSTGSTPTLVQGSSAPWDTSAWDVSKWGSDTQLGYNWQWVGGIGFAGTIQLQTNTKGITLAIDAISYAYEIGGLY